MAVFNEQMPASQIMRDDTGSFVYDLVRDADLNATQSLASYGMKLSQADRNEIEDAIIEVLDKPIHKKWLVNRLTS